jgi:hypothetical protein
MKRKQTIENDENKVIQMVFFNLINTIPFFYLNGQFQAALAVLLTIP